MEPRQKEDGDGTLSQHDIAPVPVADVEGALRNFPVITFRERFLWKRFVQCDSGSPCCLVSVIRVFQLRYYRVQS